MERKSLATLLLSASLSSCAPVAYHHPASRIHVPAHFEGMVRQCADGVVEDDLVRFYKANKGTTSVLEVYRPDGTSMTFRDLDGDLQIDVIELVQGNSATVLFSRTGQTKNPELFRYHQHMFETYLGQITRQTAPHTTLL